MSSPSIFAQHKEVATQFRNDAAIVLYCGDVNDFVDSLPLNLSN